MGMISWVIKQMLRGFVYSIVLALIYLVIFVFGMLFAGLTLGIGGILLMILGIPIGLFISGWLQELVVTKIVR